jgi:hypothetical protein
MDMRACNRAVVALHKRAIEHLIRGDEYGAIRLWKQALKCINGTSSPEESLESQSPKSMVSSSKEIVSTPFIQEHVDRFSRLVAIPPACLSLAEILPSKVFLLNETSLLDDSVCPRVVRDGLAAIVLYHIAVSLHRAGILKGYQYLVNKSLSFYEHSHAVVLHVGLPEEMNTLSTCISENVVKVFALSETASLA